MLLLGYPLFINNPKAFEGSIYGPMQATYKKASLTDAQDLMRFTMVQYVSSRDTMESICGTEGSSGAFFYAVRQ